MYKFKLFFWFFIQKHDFFESLKIAHEFCINVLLLVV